VELSDHLDIVGKRGSEQLITSEGRAKQDAEALAARGTYATSAQCRPARYRDDVGTPDARRFEHAHHEDR
jgi:hypothetical protein